MKTKKKAVETFTVGPVEKPMDQTNITDGVAAADASKKERFQISFDVNPDGSPDLSSMRESTRDKVREFLKDEKIRSTFGAESVNGTGAGEAIQPAAIKGLYFTLGIIEATVIPLFAKEIKPEIAQRVFIYNDTELKALEGPTTAVLKKYAAWFLKWQDEIALVTVLSSLTIQKVQMALILSRAATNQAKTPPPTPTPPQSVDTTVQ